MYYYWQIIIIVMIMIVNECANDKDKLTQKSYCLKMLVICYWWYGLNIAWDDKSRCFIVKKSSSLVSLFKSTILAAWNADVVDRAQNYMFWCCNNESKDEVFISPGAWIIHILSWIILSWLYFVVTLLSCTLRFLIKCLHRSWLWFPSSRHIYQLASHICWFFIPYFCQTSSLRPFFNTSSSYSSHVLPSFRIVYHTITQAFFTP